MNNFSPGKRNTSWLNPFKHGNFFQQHKNGEMAQVYACSQFILTVYNLCASCQFMLQAVPGQSKVVLNS